MLAGFLQPYSIYLYMFFQNPINKMSDIIIIYPKGYPQVTKEAVQKANHIITVVNAPNIDGAIEQLERVYKLTADYPELIQDKLALVINDTTLVNFPESTLEILQNLRVFIQVTTTKDLEVTLATAVTLDAMLVFPKEFIEEQHSDLAMLTLMAMRMNNRLITRLPNSAEKLSF